MSPPPQPGPLPELTEPLRLRTNLRRLAADDPARARREAPRRLAAAYRRGLPEGFAALGIRGEQLRVAFVGAEREIWLWVMGDRPFPQLDASLRGRLLRRAGAAGAAGPHRGRATSS